MPELPEVQTVVTTLQPRLVGRKITAIKHLRGDIVTPPGFDLLKAIVGRTIKSIDRRAKRIVFTLDDGKRFFIHLGMSGRLTIATSEAAIVPHTHLIATIGGSEMRFVDPRRFGGIWWLGDASADGDLGPEPLEMTAAEFASRLKATRRPIKAALMDQTVVAGLGNIYVDESLFAAGIHPLKRASRLKLPQVVALTEAIKQVLGRAIEAKGSSLRDYVDADGNRGSFQKLHSVYDRAGLDCVNCLSAIRRIVLGGRSTHFCPNCQKRN